MSTQPCSAETLLREANQRIDRIDWSQLNVNPSSIRMDDSVDWSQIQSNPTAIRSVANPVAYRDNYPVLVKYTNKRKNNNSDSESNKSRRL